jgi:type I restriction enzyme S subunit
VKAGDFLITRCNTKELVGRICIVPNSYPSLMLSDKTIKLSFNLDSVEPAYCEAVLRSRALRVQIEARATGTGGAMKNISQDDIRSLIVPLPSLAEQREFLNELRLIRAAEESLENTIQAGVKIRSEISNNA